MMRYFLLLPKKCAKNQNLVYNFNFVGNSSYNIKLRKYQVKYHQYNTVPQPSYLSKDFTFLNILFYVISIININVCPVF